MALWYGELKFFYLLCDNLDNQAQRSIIVRDQMKFLASKLDMLAVRFDSRYLFKRCEDFPKPASLVGQIAQLMVWYQPDDTPRSSLKALSLGELKEYVKFGERAKRWEVWNCLDDEILVRFDHLVNIIVGYLCFFPNDKYTQVDTGFIELDTSFKSEYAKQLKIQQSGWFGGFFNHSRLDWNETFTEMKHDPSAKYDPNAKEQAKGVEEGEGMLYLKLWKQSLMLGKKLEIRKKSKKRVCKFASKYSPSLRGFAKPFTIKKGWPI